MSEGRPKTFWRWLARGFATIICIPFLALLAPYVIAQTAPTFECSNPEEIAKINNELAQLQEEFSRESVVYARNLKDSIDKSRVAGNNYVRCTRENGIVDHLLGDDCSKEKYILDLMAKQQEMTSGIWNTYNETVRTRAILIRGKYRPCK